jgi:hypothetical protein
LKAHFNPDQPRVPAGSGRESGEWTSGGASIAPVAFRSRERKGRRRRGDGFDWIDRFLELFREPRNESAPEVEPSEPEVVKPKSKPPEPPEAEQLPDVDPNKLHHIFDKEGRELDEFLSNFDSEEEAFRAIEDATRAAIKEQNITGQYKIQIEIDGYKLGSQA